MGMLDVLARVVGVVVGFLGMVMFLVRAEATGGSSGLWGPG